MRTILENVQDWMSRRKTARRERVLSALNAEAVRLINIKEVITTSDGAKKYGVFLSGNLVAVYDKPTEELLAHLLQLRKMYVGFWQPESEYKVR